MAAFSDNDYVYGNPSLLGIHRIDPLFIVIVPLYHTVNDKFLKYEDAINIFIDKLKQLHDEKILPKIKEVLLCQKIKLIARSICDEENESIKLNKKKLFEVLHNKSEKLFVLITKKEEQIKEDVYEHIKKYDMETIQMLMILCEDLPDDIAREFCKMKYNIDLSKLYTSSAKSSEGFKKIEEPSTDLDMQNPKLNKKQRELISGAKGNSKLDSYFFKPKLG